LFSKEEIFPPEKRDASFSIHMKYMKRSPSWEADSLSASQMRIKFLTTVTLNITVF
jgi:hypothetical protein